MNYLTEEELKMDRKAVDLQIVLGLQSCIKKSDVMELLDDVRAHERLEIIKILDFLLERELRLEKPEYDKGKLKYSESKVRILEEAKARVFNV